MLKWGAVQDGTSFPEFNHARRLETWKLLLQFVERQQKSKNGNPSLYIALRFCKRNDSIV